jgi:RHS repeat-associated protein
LITETNTASGGEVTVYNYDSRNRLDQVQVKKGTNSISSAFFSYDGNNTRLSMSYSGKTTTYLQDVAGGLPVVLQETVNGQVSSFMYPEASTSPLFQSDQNNAPMWYHSDGLGSVRALTNGSGSVLETHAYGAFGTRAAGGQAGKVSNNHLFAGEQLDPTGLYFNRARYYHPELGRFMAKDPIEGDLTNPVSLNHYSYAWSNPTNLTDNSGQYPEWCKGAGFFLAPAVCTVMKIHEIGSNAAWNFLQEAPKCSQEIGVGTVFCIIGTGINAGATAVAKTALDFLKPLLLVLALLVALLVIICQLLLNQGDNDEDECKKQYPNLIPASDLGDTVTETDDPEKGELISSGYIYDSSHEALKDLKEVTAVEYSRDTLEPGVTNPSEEGPCRIGNPKGYEVGNHTTYYLNGEGNQPVASIVSCPCCVIKNGKPERSRKYGIWNLRKYYMEDRPWPDKWKDY